MATVTLPTDATYNDALSKISASKLLNVDTLIATTPSLSDAVWTLKAAEGTPVTTTSEMANAWSAPTGLSAT